MTKKRNANCDAYRIFLMLGICMLHSVTQAGHNQAWVANMFEWCVPAFAFISGWYGIRFSWGKVFRLFATSIYCAVIFFAFDILINGGTFDWFRTYKVAVGQWFLTAYVVMMCLAPLVELALEKVREMFAARDYWSVLKTVSPFLVCVFVWAFSCGLPGFKHVMPRANGLGGYSFTMLLGAYLCARILRFALESQDDRWLLLNRKRLLFPVLAVCIICASIGMGDYDSPFSIGIATCIFLLFMRVRLPHWLQSLFIVLAPSMFSVYLMHSHGLAWGYLALVEDWLLNHGVPLGFAYLLTAVTVFVVCVVGDLPRRIFALLWDRYVTRKYVLHA